MARGTSGNNVTIQIKLSSGEVAEHTFEVWDGADAYQIWNSINGGSMDDFMEYMKGKQGVGIAKIEVTEVDDGLAADEIAITRSDDQFGVN